MTSLMTYLGNEIHHQWFYRGVISHVVKVLGGGGGLSATVLFLSPFFLYCIVPFSLFFSNSTCTD